MRLYKLGSVPASPDWDEAALGYNAYSILKTGRDEYGIQFPLSIRSFDDYKPPLYTYLTIPSVAVFGLNVFSVRLPSAIFGIFAVVGVYLLTKELFTQKGFRKYSGTFSTIPYIAAFLLAISPWHLQFSRIAFEANIGVTLNIWGAYMFFRSFRQKALLPFSAIFFGLGLWAYHSERVFVPLLALGLLILYRNRIFTQEKKRMIILTSAIGMACIIPFLYIMLGSGLSRLKGTSWISNPTDLLKQNVLRLEIDRNNHDTIGLILDNRRFVYVKTFIEGYISHFSLRWLFLTGDNARHHAPDMGLLYFIELPFFIYGLITLGKYKSRETGFIIYWFLISPIAAAPTTGLPHAVRTLVFLPTIQIATAVGFMGIFDGIRTHWKSNRVIKYVFLSTTCLLLVCNLGYYLTMYYARMDKEYSEFWQYGYREAIKYAEAKKDNYKKIIVSTRLEQPYIFFLFFTGYSPKKYLAEGGTASGGFEERLNAFDKYEFRTIDWAKEKKDGSILYIGAPGEIPHRLGSQKYLNGKPSIEIADRE